MKNLFKDFVTFLGRILISLIFILTGLSKIGDFAGNVAFIHSRGIPFASFFLYVAVLIEISCALMIITGYKARLGALVLAVFLVPVTYIFHYLPAFSAGISLNDQKIQMISLMKNISIIGGLLLIYGNGVGKWTIGKD